MAVPYEVATAILASGSTNYSFSVSHAAPVGDGITVTLGVGGTAPPAVSSVTDSKGNTYTQKQQSSASPYLAAFESAGTHALTTSDTISLVFAATTTGGIGVAVTGTPAMTTTDVSTAIASGSSTAPSVSGTPAASGEIALALFVWANAAGAGSLSSPWTQLTQVHPTGGAYTTVGYISNPTSGTGLTAGATIVSGSWRAMILSVQPSGGGGGSATSLTWFTNASYIQNLDSADHATAAAFFNTPTAFALGNNAGSPVSLPSGYTTTPMLKYIAYGQFWADVTGSNKTVGGVTYTPVSGGIDPSYHWLMYDTEKWNPNPPSPYSLAENAAEIDDPWTYMASFVTLAHAHGYQVLLPPARDLGNQASSVHPLNSGESLDAWVIRTNLIGGAASAGADIVHVQTQADQTNGQFKSFWSSTYAQSIAAAPSVPVTSGVSTTSAGSPTATDMFNAAQSVLPQAAGFWLNMSAGTVSTAISFLKLMQATPLPGGGGGGSAVSVSAGAAKATGTAPAATGPGTPITPGGSGSAAANVPIGVFRGRMGQYVASGNTGVLTPVAGMPPIASSPLSSIQAYENWLGEQVNYVEDFAIEAPATWTQFEQCVVGTIGGVNVPLGNWGDIGSRKMLFSVSPCAGASIGSGGATWADEAAGVNDSHWTALGNYLVSHGYEDACLRIGREWNGNWYPWAVTAANLSDFVSGWQHIVTLLNGLTGSNFTYCWNPYLGLGNNSSGITDVTTAYPGDAYVDSIGLDVYDGGYTAEGSPFTRTITAQQARFASQQSQVNGLDSWVAFAKSRGKQLAFPEWGLVLWNATAGAYTGGGDNAYFIRSMASLYIPGAAFAALWEHYDNGVFDPDTDPGRNGLTVSASRLAFLQYFAPTSTGGSGGGGSGGGGGVSFTVPPRRDWHFLLGPTTGGHDYEVRPSTGRQVTFKLTDAHSAQFTVNCKTGLDSIIVPLATDLHIVRAGQELFRGRVGPASDDLDAGVHTATFTAKSYKGILQRRILYATDVLAWTSVDVGTIAWNLVNGTQQRTAGDLGIIKGQGIPLGTTGSKACQPGDVIATKIDDMAYVDSSTPGAGGFDWDITPTDASSQQIDLWKNGRGASKGVYLQWGDSLTGSKWSRTLDADGYANAIRMTGGGTTPPSPVEMEDTPTLATLPQGRWDAAYNTDEADATRLAARTTLQLGIARQLWPSYTIPLRPGVWGGPTHIWLGDTVAVRVNSGRLTDTELLRVSEIGVTLSQEGEQVTLTVGVPRPDLRRKFAQIVEQIRQVRKIPATNK